MNPEIDTMISRLKHARLQLDAVIEQAAPGIEIFTTWKLKQMLDHIAGWDELMVTAFRAHTRGDPPVSMQASNLDQFNAGSVDSRADLLIDESRRDYDLVRQMVLDVLRTMPLEAFQRPFTTPWGRTCSIQQAVEIFASHEEEHASHMLESLADHPGAA